MLSTIIVIFTLLIIASGVHQLAKRLKIPYTILLFMCGILLVPLDTLFGWQLIETVSLTPELLFFVFLPVLIFEAWYHIQYKQLTQNYITIRTLAIAWLLISTAILWFGGHYLLKACGINIPLHIMLLFGVIISSTDPVAVLAIFKHLWVPKRLGLIFEGESLFNDGIAVAVFLVMLEIFSSPWFQTQDIRWGIGDFFMMVIGWIVLWTVLGIVFASIIKQIKNNEHVEITLTMVLAHVVFLLAEYISIHTLVWGIDIKISWVIATAYAAIIMGNYGKTKISPKVEAYMDKFWSFFSFVTNSLVFLLMGMMAKYISLPYTILLPSLGICIALLIVWRALAVYIPLGIVNKIKHTTQRIPHKRQHLLAWGSLRWALWLMLVLLIPDDFVISWWTYTFSPKQYILWLTIGAIMFSLIVRGLTIKRLIRSLNMWWLIDIEEFELLESHILVYDNILKKIRRMHIAYEISPIHYEMFIQKYEAKMEEARLHMQLYLERHPDHGWLLHKALSLHALGIEKEYLHQMFSYNEIPEHIYFSRKAKIETQTTRIQSGLAQIRWFKSSTDIKPTSRYPIERLLYRVNHCDTCDTKNAYIIARTKYILTQHVIDELHALKDIPFGYEKKYIQNVIDLYQKFHDNARQDMQELGEQDETFINMVNAHLLNKTVIKHEEKLIQDLFHKDMITKKIYLQFVEEMDTELRKGYV